MFKQILKSNRKTIIFNRISGVMCNCCWLCFCCADNKEKRRESKQLKQKGLQKPITPTANVKSKTTPKIDPKTKKQTTDHWIREIESFYGNKVKTDNKLTTEVGDAIDPEVTPSEIPDKDITKTYELPYESCQTVKDMIDYLGYEFLSIIGKGGFGLVRKCYHLDKNTGIKKLLACKEIILYKKNKDIKNLKSEIYVLRKCKHPYIIELVNHFIIKTGEEAIAFLFMEFADSTLQTEINSGPLSDPMAKYYFVQTTIALCYLHRLRIAHKDLKPENILLVINEKIGLKQVKVGDFGLSQNVYKAKEGVIKSGHFGGTRAYMAPEIVRLEVFREHRKALALTYDPFKSDFWALGVCLFEMLTKLLPFESHNLNQLLELQEEKSFGYPRAIRDTMDPNADNLIRQLLEPDVNKRIDPLGVLTHPWIKNEVDWTLINTPQENKEQNKT